MKLENIKYSEDSKNKKISMDIKEENNIIAKIEILKKLSELNQNQENNLSILNQINESPYKHSIAITILTSDKLISEISNFLYPTLGIMPTYTKNLSSTDVNTYSADVIIDYDLIFRTLEVLELNQIDIEITSINTQTKHRI